MPTVSVERGKCSIQGKLEAKIEATFINHFHVNMPGTFYQRTKPLSFLHITALGEKSSTFLLLKIIN
jgi:hypothetical protein